jgi:Uma2 family endonuclease
LFPEEAEVPESQLHLDLRTLLYHLLSDYLGQEAIVGSDQFVYFDAADPKQSLAPDVYVRLEPRGEPVRSWKTWERGAPDVAVEIVSESDVSELSWAEKLNRYRRLGVTELVRFDPEAAHPHQLRIWDRVNEALVERELSGGPARSMVLGLHWVVAEGEGYRHVLRIGEGEKGGVLVPSRTEARQKEAEARQKEAEARQAAEARIRELEALLKQRG